MLLALFIAVESRVEHPLLPFRIFANRTRAASFVAMALLPAAMFSMFFFLSLFIQNVMGYSPLKTGVAFLPFSVGIVLSAGIVSNLVNRIDARYIAGVGTLIASGALFGFSRLSVPDTRQRRRCRRSLSGQYLGADVNYWTQIFPFVVLMALGMGAVFVPLTLTAVHHVRVRGLRHRLGRAQHHAAGRRRARPGDPRAPWRATTPPRTSRRSRPASAAASSRPTRGPRRLMSAFGVGSFQDLVGQVAYLGSFTEGATAAFLVGVVPDAGRLRGGLGVPRRQARGARHRRAREGVHVG